MRYLSCMAMAASPVRCEQEPAACVQMRVRAPCMAGADVAATLGSGWCISSFLTGQKTPLDSTGNAKLLVFSVPQKNLVIRRCVVCRCMVFRRCRP